jgi:uncharacterized protein YjbI with pentapeptide repeats
LFWLIVVESLGAKFMIAENTLLSCPDESASPSSNKHALPPNSIPTGANSRDTSSQPEVANQAKQNKNNVIVKVWNFVKEPTVFAGLVAVFATWATFSITQDVQERDGRQKALNDYVNGMKELIASTQVDRSNGQMAAGLKNSRTFLVMRELDGDGDRKGQALRFLYETCLIRSNCSRTTPKVTLNGINLNGIVLEDAWVPHLNLQKTYMKGANLKKADLTRADLTEADLTPNQEKRFWQTLPVLGWVLKPLFPGVVEADLQEANLSSAILNRANLSNANLSRVNLRGADLRNTNLTGAELESAIYDSNTDLPSLTEQQQRRILEIKPRALLAGKNLSNQNLSTANLQDADLQGTNLSRANLSGANLMNARLDGAILEGATFCRTIMPDGTVNNQNCP